LYSTIQEQISVEKVGLETMHLERIEKDEGHFLMHCSTHNKTNENGFYTHRQLVHLPKFQYKNQHSTETSEPPE
jgi:hypothetical protein